MNQHTIDVLKPGAPRPCPKSDPAAIVGGRVELQLLTTLKCNLKCTYCSLGVGEVLGSQTQVGYTIDHLAAFVDKHLKEKEVYVTFYGGEPLLNGKMIQEVMQRFPLFRYQLQTNGTLLDNLPDWVLHKLSNILVSIDGGEETTDGYRGRGIWRQVIKNVGHVRDRVGGTVTARVTWGRPDTCFEELDDLAESFDYLYWQFVADEHYFDDSVAKRQAVLVQLIDKFFRRTDKLYPLIPLMGMVRNKLFPSRATELYAGQTQCRVSTHIINVMPDGKIFPCPDMMYVPEMQQGDIMGNWLRRSPLQPHPDMPCEGCEAFSWCRRNCMKNLYLGYVKNDLRYRTNVVEPICELIKFMGQEIDRHNPAEWFAQASLPVRNQVIGAEVYEYCEIMP
ncbi:radical SAM/SPASM domain-containing protein [Denitratisoma oestradiolicum]|uniref:Radical SAM protein n=1 Tax=Denitratisoma oestradiolicum TaxID=311182 RepID=A0A6S6XVA1_9PROT|nr:radical SAM protein [Denitratisoma oestradiolicum]TWO80177.1 radical SAM protein [Denitratisoma oestradiolicum]CAB1369974.1 Radical SAM protein [Denitratisoma oestradiolicum]